MFAANAERLAMGSLYDFRHIAPVNLDLPRLITMERCALSVADNEQTGFLCVWLTSVKVDI